jgi:anti-sigma B factor antagonist
MHVLPQPRQIHQSQAPNWSSRRRAGRLSPVPEHFKVAVEDRDGATVLTLSGELDLAASPMLEQKLEHALGQPPALVIVDLRQLEFIDSTGLSVLVRARQRAQEQSRRFVLAGAGAQVQRLLSLTGIAERLELAESLEQALGSGSS